jgi:hypothetical protein
MLQLGGSHPFLRILGIPFVCCARIGTSVQICCPSFPFVSTRRDLLINTWLLHCDRHVFMCRTELSEPRILHLASGVSSPMDESKRKRFVIRACIISVHFWIHDRGGIAHVFGHIQSHSANLLLSIMSDVRHPTRTQQQDPSPHHRWTENRTIFHV